MKIKPIRRNTDRSKKHITDRLFERSVSPEDRIAVLRHLLALSQLFEAGRVDAPDPASKWWMPLTNEWHMAGFGDQGNTLGSPVEIPMTDAAMVVNPTLDRLDRRNWRMRLNRIRPDDATRIVDTLLGHQTNRLMDDIMQPNEFSAQAPDAAREKAAQKALEALATRDQSRCFDTLVEIGEELRPNIDLFSRLADAAFGTFEPDSSSPNPEPRP